MARTEQVEQTVVALKIASDACLHHVKLPLSHPLWVCYNQKDRKAMQFIVYASTYQMFISSSLLNCCSGPVLQA